MYRELLLGCGFSREKRVIAPNTENFRGWTNLTTLDINSKCEPDIVFDLSSLGYQKLNSRPLKCLVPYPTGLTDENALTLALHAMIEENKAVVRWNNESVMPANEFDEIHAYEILEHLGEQGDFITFFRQFREFHRVMKPGGYFCATVPDYRSVWAWGDPGHTRIINQGTLVFLSKRQYEQQLGRTAMSDYRDHMGDMDFDIIRAQTKGETLEFVLRAIK